MCHVLTQNTVNSTDAIRAVVDHELLDPTCNPQKPALCEPTVQEQHQQLMQQPQNLQDT
jgi:hypothetical protein